jgi:hypothetical protein
MNIWYSNVSSCTNPINIHSKNSQVAPPPPPPPWDTGVVHNGARPRVADSCLGVATSLAYPSVEEGDNLLIEMISTGLGHT